MITLDTKWCELLILTSEDVYTSFDAREMHIRGGNRVLYRVNVAVYVFDNDEGVNCGIKFLKNRHSPYDDEEISNFVIAWYSPNKANAHKLGLF